MRKVLVMFVVIVLSGVGFLASFLSFDHGSVRPDYGPTIGYVSCASLAIVGPTDVREITYHKGFPFQKSGVDEFDVSCAPSSSYALERGEIISSWQFYANAVIYSAALLGFILFVRLLLKWTTTLTTSKRTT